jgi:hypothetical protein
MQPRPSSSVEKIHTELSEWQLGSRDRLMFSDREINEPLEAFIVHLGYSLEVANRRFAAHGFTALRWAKSDINF